MRSAATLALVLSSAAALAQSPAFEVATVKVNNSGSGGAGFPGLRAGMVTGKNATLRMYLRAAYGLSESRIIGPGWLDTDRFDVTAKLPRGASPAQAMPMLQTLLKERFHLETHRERRELPVFNMVVAKGGLKMQPSTPDEPFPRPPANPGGSMNVGAGTMPEIAQRLSGEAGRSILDKTGVEGRYGFLLIYARPSTGPGDSALPDYFTAIEQQLGLKLKPANEPLDVLVVDHAERTPAEN